MGPRRSDRSLFCDWRSHHRINTNRKDNLSMHKLRNVIGFIKIMSEQYILDINIDAFGQGVNLK